MLMVWVSINHQLLESHDNQLWFSCSGEVKVNSSKEGEPSPIQPINQSIVQFKHQSAYHSIERPDNLSFDWKTRQLIIRLKYPWIYSSIEKSMNWFFNWMTNQLVIQFNLLFNWKTDQLSMSMNIPGDGMPCWTGTKHKCCKKLKWWHGDICVTCDI